MLLTDQICMHSVLPTMLFTCTVHPPMQGQSNLPYQLLPQQWDRCESTATPGCPANYNLNMGACSCTASLQPGCPSGYSASGPCGCTCTASSSPSCPASSPSLNSGSCQCVGSQSPSCPSGYSLSGSCKCQCARRPCNPCLRWSDALCGCVPYDVNPPPGCPV